ncbi:hypothetical protein [uncultured Ruminococcus sp.]|uniref:hypothetical protein n=1 Tax=uncultured Ruminococcus sp. TaxID=165186 RepID=UPI00262C9BB3|nr:hypothetical protein [uncultured Ruminococcus sp.]
MKRNDAEYRNILLCILFGMFLLTAYCVHKNQISVESFSFSHDADVYQFEDIQRAGVKTNGFSNTQETSVTNAGQAVALAKNELTISYNQIAVEYDAQSCMWRVCFSTKNTAGNEQAVYLNSDGTTRLCTWGE